MRCALFVLSFSLSFSQVKQNSIAILYGPLEFIQFNNPTRGNYNLFFHSQTLGFVVLGGVQVHGLNVAGLVINTAGGLWYSYAKYQQKKSKQPKLESDLEAHSK